jgi:hypothetical protein
VIDLLSDVAFDRWIILDHPDNHYQEEQYYDQPNYQAI